MSKEMDLTATVHTCQLYVVYSLGRVYAWVEQGGRADLCKTDDGETASHPSFL